MPVVIEVSRSRPAGENLDSIVRKFVAAHGTEDVITHATKYLTAGPLNDRCVNSLKNVARKWYPQHGAAAVDNQFACSRHFATVTYLTPIMNPESLDAWIVPALAAHKQGLSSFVMVSSGNLQGDAWGDPLTQLCWPISVNLGGEFATLKPTITKFPLLSNKDNQKLISRAPAVTTSTIERLKRQAPGLFAAQVIEQVLSDYHQQLVNDTPALQHPHSKFPELFAQIRDALPLGAPANDVYAKACDNAQRRHKSLLAQPNIANTTYFESLPPTLPPPALDLFRAVYSALSVRAIKREVVDVAEDLFSPRRVACLTQASTFVQGVLQLNSLVADEIQRGSGLPRILMLPMDEIVEELLLDALDYPSSGTPLADLLKSPDILIEVVEALEGAPQAWNSRTATKMGSHLFWSVKDGRISPLWMEGHALVGREKVIPLRPEVLAHEIREGALVPTTVGRHLTLLLSGALLVDGPIQASYHAEWGPRFSKVAALSALGSLGQNPAITEFPTPAKLHGLTVAKLIAGCDGYKVQDLLNAFSSQTVSDVSRELYRQVGASLS